jgi:hypothetical protein
MFAENDVILPTVSSNNDCSSDFDYGRVDNLVQRYHRSGADKASTERDSKAPRHDLPSVIYRFKFTEGFMEELYKFSKIHQYDERKDFKEAWTQWLEDNNDIIEEEDSRLQQLGYDGDVLTKMFKSARYYFRKKSTEKQEPKQRRKYITVKKELLDAMDLHIETNYLNEGYQPKIGYTQFCEENVELIKKIVDKIVESGENDMQTINDKIKKTYKNRYFIIAKK